jgi:group II intron reverse transcriptase/maturase
MQGYSTRENRETSVVSVRGEGRGEGADRSAKATSHTADMHVAEESDGCIVPTTHPNNDAQAASAEDAEGRRPVAENTERERPVPDAGPDMGGSHGLRGVREAAQQDKRRRFTALLHHVSVDRLRASFYALQRDAAPGVDGVTWRTYGRELEPHLIALHDRVHRGSYRAQPSKRAYIPKADGRLRPLGIAALEDKIVQHAVGVVLSQVYEADFLGFSYGFRPGRSPHDALAALVVGIEQRRVNWVLDADIRGFFDTLQHEWLLTFLEHRVADPRVLRLVRKWLKAGVSEEGEWSSTTVGTPQGAVISPLLANLYLHYVFDRWIQRWREREARGDVIVVRYADDIVMGFEHRHEAERCLVAWRARLAQFGLLLHPEKTRLLEFGRHAVEQRKRRGAGKPETFDFLGFTHFCGTSRRSGRVRVQRKSSRKRMRLKLRAIRAELAHRWHQPAAVVGQWLRRVVQGYFNYHAVPFNGPSLNCFRTAVIRAWFHGLRRRSQRGRVTWARFTPLVRVWIPPVRILHPYPSVRFAASHPR